MAYEGKLYTHEKDDNFDAFIDSIGLPDDQVAALKSFKPQQKLEKNGDTFTLSSVTPANTKVVTFKLGEEIDETVAGGRVAKTTFTFDGNTLTQVQKFDDGNVLTTKREYHTDKLIATITRTNWDGTAVRYYKV